MICQSFLCNIKWAKKREITFVAITKLQKSVFFIMNKWISKWQLFWSKKTAKNSFQMNIELQYRFWSSWLRPGVALWFPFTLGGAVLFVKKKPVFFSPVKNTFNPSIFTPFWTLKVFIIRSLRLSVNSFRSKIQLKLLIIG